MNKTRMTSPLNSLYIHIYIESEKPGTTVYEKILVPKNNLCKCAICGCKIDKFFDKKEENWYFK